MFTGAHVILYSSDPEADRAFVRDVLGFRHVDAGDGWLIFALPPAEVAIHPSDGLPRHELYVMCDDIRGQLAELESRGVEVVRRPTELRWGVIASIRLPSGSELAIYEPRHPSP